MDKKHKQQRQKTLTKDEVLDVTPPGASFDTEAGRAAHGMRKDIGKGDESDAQEEKDKEASDADD